MEYFEKNLIKNRHISKCSVVADVRTYYSLWRAWTWCRIQQNFRTPAILSL